MSRNIIIPVIEYVAMKHIIHSVSLFIITRIIGIANFLFLYLSTNVLQMYEMINF